MLNNAKLIQVSLDSKPVNGTLTRNLNNPVFKLCLIKLRAINLEGYRTKIDCKRLKEKKMLKKGLSQSKISKNSVIKLYGLKVFMQKKLKFAVA